MRDGDTIRGILSHAAHEASEKMRADWKLEVTEFGIVSRKMWDPPEMGELAKDGLVRENTTNLCARGALKAQMAVTEFGEVSAISN